MPPNGSSPGKSMQLVVALNAVLLLAACFFLYRAVHERDEAQTALVYLLAEKEDKEKTDAARLKAEVRLKQQEEQVALESKREWQLVFQDDFSSADMSSRWQILGQWEIKGGELHLFGGEPQMALIKMPITGDARIEFDCHVEGDLASEISCFLSATPSPAKLSEVPGSGYLFHRGDRDNSPAIIFREGVEKYSESTPALKPGQRYHIRAELAGKRLSFHIDGITTISVEDDHPLVGNAHSAAGIYGWKSHVYYDNVRVYKLGLPDSLAIVDTTELLINKGHGEAALVLIDEMLTKNLPPAQRQQLLFQSVLAFDKLNKTPEAMQKLKECIALDATSATGIVSAIEVSRRSNQPLEKLGDIVIRKKLEPTWSGDVYLCSDPKIERDVVMKILDGRITEQNVAIERYLFEVKTLSHCDCPGTLKIYRSERAGPLHLIVTSYVEGENLDNYLRKADGKERFKVASRTLRQLLETIDCYQAKHVVHRALRPNNIVVDGTGQPVIVDFSHAMLNTYNPYSSSNPYTAALRQACAACGQVHTASNVGTPYLTSPDQWKAPSTADIRDDLYSLGAMYYSILANRPPFAGQSIEDIQRLAADPAIEAAPLKNLAPGIPDELAQVIHKLMAKQRPARFQTPLEALNALKKIPMK
jgi:hypothetical protein